jgi:lipoprotein-releasing system permease protein
MMFHTFEWQLALKFTKRSKSKKDKFISFIAVLSMMGIALGVAALIIVLSVMNGFQKEVRDRMLSVLSHIELTQNAYLPTTSSSTLTSANTIDWTKLKQTLKQGNGCDDTLTEKTQQCNKDIAKQTAENIQGIAPFVQGQAMLLAQNNMYGVLIRGIDPQIENQVSEITANIKDNQNNKLSSQQAEKLLQPNQFKAWLGKPLAEHMGLNIGDKITVAVASKHITPLGATPRLKSMEIVGILDSGHYEFDSALIVTHIKDAQTLLLLDDIQGLRLKLKDMHQAPLTAYNIQQQFPDLIAKDWSQQNRTWFTAVKTEKRMMFIILSLMVAVAAFNLVSTLVMSVKDKQGNIAIMRTFGASAASIRKIFMYQGLIIGFGGTLLGLLFGCLIAFNVGSIVGFLETIFNTKFLPQSIYLISSMPSDPRLNDIALIVFGSMFMTLIATLYPSYRASKLYPAEVLRHE